MFSFEPVEPVVAEGAPEEKPEAADVDPELAPSRRRRRSPWARWRPSCRRWSRTQVIGRRPAAAERVYHTLKGASATGRLRLVSKVASGLPGPPR